MFSPLRKLQQDNSGIIMVTVLVLVLVLTVIAIGILGLNVSQVSTSESVVDTIRQEQLAIGAFYQYHQQQIEGNLTLPSPRTETIDGRTYTVSIQSTAGTVANPTPNNVNQIDVTITRN